MFDLLLWILAVCHCLHTKRVQACKILTPCLLTLERSPCFGWNMSILRTFYKACEQYVYTKLTTICWNPIQTANIDEIALINCVLHLSTPPLYKLKLTSLTSTNESKPTREYWWATYHLIWPHFLSNLRVPSNNTVDLHSNNNSVVFYWSLLKHPTWTVLFCSFLCENLMSIPLIAINSLLRDPAGLIYIV